MDWNRRAHKVLQAAEKSLADLAAEAVKGRDYPFAARLLAAAQRVAAALGDEAGTRPAARPSPPATSVEAESPEPKAGRKETSAPAPGPDDAGSAPTAPAPPANTAKAGYPLFLRERDTLVKIGWSKTDGATYEHRSPRAVLDLLAAAVRKHSTTGRKFTTDDLMPLRDANGHEQPSYQAYLCLAWLVLIGALVRHGRSGYTVRTPAMFDKVVDEAWGQLPQR